jgi:hypothetical protein
VLAGLPGVLGGFGNRFAWEDERKEVDFDDVGAAEEFEEDFDAFGGGEDLDDFAVHAAKRSVGDFDRVAGEDFWGECDAFGVAVFGMRMGLRAEGFDKCGRDGWDFSAKADQSADALGEGDGALHFLEVEFGEQVAGEHGFDPPDFAAAGCFAVSQAWAEDFDCFERAKMLGGDVFAFGLGTDAVPEEVRAGGCGVHEPRSF